MAENKLDAGALAEALTGRGVEGYSVDARAGRVRIGLTGLLLELEGVDALFLEGPGGQGEIAHVGVWTGPAKGEDAEDLSLALELLRLDEERSPFAGGRVVIQIEPEEDEGLHLVARFSELSVEEDEEDGDDDEDATG